MIERILTVPELRHVHFDISWDVTAKYLAGSEESAKISAYVINGNPTRFLFGTDSVAPKTKEKYFATYNKYGPLWKALSPEAKSLVTKGNYERIFDHARKRVRAWERRQATSSGDVAPETTVQ